MSSKIAIKHCLLVTQTGHVLSISGNQETSSVPERLFQPEQLHTNIYSSLPTQLKRDGFRLIKFEQHKLNSHAPLYLVYWIDTFFSYKTHLEHQIDDMTQQLMQSEKLASIGQLAAGVAHEINNPIGYIASNLSALADYANTLVAVVKKLSHNHPTPESLKILDAADFDYVANDLTSLVNETEEGLQRVITIIKALKDFSHIDEVDFSEMNLIEAFESTLNIVANEVKYRANVIKKFEPVPIIQCIPSQIKQVMLNLLINAAQSMNTFGEIIISTAHVGNKVVFEITDSGCGIPAAKLAHIFQPFFTTKSRGVGTGLGLSLSLSIIEKHHGCIEVSSEVDKGTTFTVTLPITQQNQARS